MKLVEILGKHLKKWPDGSAYMVQDPARDMDIWSCPNEPIWEGGEWGAKDGERSFSCQLYSIGLADDHSTAVITKDQWQAERDRQKGGEWKRHRGGKCPVDHRVQVEVKFRDGDIRKSHAGDFFGWKHGELDDKAAEVMQYRIISQPQAEEVEVIDFKIPTGAKVEMRCGDEWSTIGHTPEAANIGTITYKVELDTSAATQAIDELTAKWDQIDGPLAWRDRIIHCQAIIEDCEREIQRNADLLDAEGLYMQLNAKVGMASGEPAAIPFSEWKVGDIVEVISKATFSAVCCDVGDQLPIIAVDNRDNTVKVEVGAWGDEDNYRFIRRP